LLFISQSVKQSTKKYRTSVFNMNTLFVLKALSNRNGFSYTRAQISDWDTTIYKCLNEVSWLLLTASYIKLFHFIRLEVSKITANSHISCFLCTACMRML